MENKLSVNVSAPRMISNAQVSVLVSTHPGLSAITYAVGTSVACCATRALRLGASGYLTKDSSTTALIEAVRKAATGSKYVSASLAERFAVMLGGRAAASHEALPNRALEVLKLIANGQSLIDVGDCLYLSPKTVTAHRARIFEKLGIGSNAELARYTVESGLLG